MNQKHSLSFVIMCVGVLFATEHRCIAEANQYDFSSPEATFRSCGLAITNNDPQTYYKAIVTNRRNPAYDEQFLQEIWNGKDPEGRRHYGMGLCSPTVQRTGKVAEYFLQSEFLKKVEDRKAPVGEMRVYLVKWKAAKLIRREFFIRFDKDGYWRWAINLDSQDIPYLDSYKTPTDAFCTIEQAQFLRLETEVCRGLASVARGEMGVEKCDQTLRERLSKLSKTAADDVWINSALTACEGCLEEEMFTEKDGSQRCRVWETEKDTGSKRVRRRYELFIKEGNEWKWLPDSKSFWNIGAWEATPAKKQDK